MTDSSSSSGVCPHCGQPATGRFCASCGGSLAGPRCAHCNTELKPGARFCHNCGGTVGEPGHTRHVPVLTHSVPWMVAGIAVLVLLVVVAAERMSRTENFVADTTAMAASGSPSDSDAVRAGGGAGNMPVVRGPDISHMSPEERASRLHDRMMAAYEHGHTDTVDMFAPMAFEAYRMLDSLTLDEHYDLGRLGEIAGAPDLARAEADTILHAHPTHLLGLILAAHAARMQGDTVAAHQYRARFLSAEPAEEATHRPEYQLHANDIIAFLKNAHQH